MKTIFSLFFNGLFLVSLLISCQQGGEELSEMEDPWDAYPFEEVHISKTEKFVKQFAELTGSTFKSAHISDFLNGQSDQKLYDLIEETNQKMISSGFDNFDLSNVYYNSENQVIFYPLFRADDPKNMNHCMPFLRTANSTNNDPSLTEGPVTVAMALAAETDARTYDTNQVASHFLPISLMQNGTGNFEEGMDLHSYATASGTVEITYERLYDSIFEGVIKVNAFSSDGTYQFKKVWKVTYD